jgi:hypothetical protein
MPYSRPMPRLRGHPWRIASTAVLAAIASVVAMNLFDEELTPEARALFERPVRVFDKESGWAIIAGMNAPVATSPRDFSEQLWRVKRTRTPPHADGMLEVRAAAELLCQPESGDCVDMFRVKPGAAADLAADNAVLLARYDELLRSTDLADVTDALDYFKDSSFFNVVMGTQRVRLSQAAAAAASGQVDAAIGWLESDAAFYRRWLEQSGSILSKMLALRGLSHDLLLAGQVARSTPFLDASQWDRLDAIVSPLTQGQRAFAEVARTEAGLFREILDRWVADPRATGEIIGAPRFGADVAGRTLKRNATLNFTRHLFEPWLRLDGVDSPGLEPAIEAAKAGIRRVTTADWKWLYNYPGKAIASESSPDLSEYVYRLRDLDALAALARCVIGLQRTRTGRDAAAAFVTQSKSCRDPYGGAFEWNPGRAELSFRPRASGQAKRFGGRDDRVIFAAYDR